MTIYIALLRGINVGGKHMVKMADLRRMLETMGLGQVKTYIQSGNVLFESGEGVAVLRQRIEREIRTVFGVSSTVVLRTAEELEQIIRNCPFIADSLVEGQSIHVSLLTEVPSQDKLDILAKVNGAPDEYQVQGREIYFLFRQRSVDSNYTKSLTRLGDSVTSRNWNTMKKLTEMAKAMEV